MSNAAPQTGEPTMEEILASIRRIISEEEGEPAKPAGEEAAAAPAPVAEAAPQPVQPDDDDVLELTQIVHDSAPKPEPVLAAVPPPPPRARPTLVEMENDIAFDGEP